jgi:hypothetical protein
MFETRLGHERKKEINNKKDEQNITELRQKILKSVVGISLSFLTYATPVGAKNSNQSLVFDQDQRTPIEYTAHETIVKDGYKPKYSETTLEAISDIMLERMRENNLMNLKLPDYIYQKTAKSQANTILKKLQLQGISKPTKNDIYKLLGNPMLAANLAVIEKVHLGESASIYTEYTKDYFSGNSSKKFRDEMLNHSIKEDGWKNSFDKQKPDTSYDFKDIQPFVAPQIPKKSDSIDFRYPALILGIGGIIAWLARGGFRGKKSRLPVDKVVRSTEKTIKEEKPVFPEPQKNTYSTTSTLPVLTKGLIQSQSKQYQNVEKSNYEKFQDLYRKHTQK